MPGIKTRGLRPPLQGERHSHTLRLGVSTRRKLPPRDAELASLPSAAGKIAGPSAAFATVGIGASAGGLKALEAFLNAMPANPGVAIVVVTHQHPTHVSFLPELLARICPMPVEAARDGVRLEPNRTYVGPPGQDAYITGGTLRLKERPAVYGLHLPIDGFFRSLAEDQAERAICIVLSGTGSDGTLGLRAVKGNGGMALVQDEGSAGYTGMPHSAAGTLLADAILSPEEMPSYVLRYARRVAQRGAEDEYSTETIQNILAMVCDRTGHDLSGYKSAAIRRRVERRMRVHDLSEATEYAQLLQANPHELDLLLSELLINVTSFFRDPEVFLTLGAALERLIAESPESTLRIWVSACSSGEEAYSLAILASEILERSKKHRTVQIFATDLDGPAIDYARLGIFAEGIAADVGPERLARYFVKQGNRYRVKDHIRELVVFATQNLLKDPPFTRLDLITCRNFLIYLKPEVQRRLIPLFHYALRKRGLLLLGTSESIIGFDELLFCVDAKAKLFSRREASAAARQLPLSLQRASRMRPGPTLKAAPPTSITLAIDKLLLERFAPPTVIVNQAGEIVYTHGKTGDYLELAPGEPRSNLFDMARGSLRGDLPAALRRAAKQGAEVQHEVLASNYLVRLGALKLRIARISDPEALQGLYRVSFEAAVTQQPTARVDAPAPLELAQERNLAAELHQTRETLQGAIEELQSSNEELRSANEESQSMNEELQSSNEELETSKEELQSLNEELQTVNLELQLKIDQLSQISDDMQNVLNSTDIATIFLDRELRIKRFTEQARELVSLIPADVGRNIADLVVKVRYAALVADARHVLESLLPNEVEVQTPAGSWRLLRMRPYRTSRNSIDGVVITLVDIDRVKRAELLAASRAFAESIVQTVREPLVVLDRELRVVSANQAFSQLFNVSQADIATRTLAEVGGWLLEDRELARVLTALAAKGQTFQDFALNGPNSISGTARLVLNGRPLQGDVAGHLLVAFGLQSQPDAVG